MARLRKAAWAGAALAAALLLAFASRPLDAWGVLGAWLLVSLLVSASLAAALPSRFSSPRPARAHRPRGIEADPARKILQEGND